MKIYVDFDDVVTETARSLAELLHRERGRVVPYEAIVCFDLRVSFQLADDEYHAFMDRAHESAILDALPETPGACPTLRAWVRDGLSPFVVTGRPADSHDATRRWLDRRGLSEVPVLHVDKYNRDAGSPDAPVPTLRFDELAGLGFQLAIDDAPPALNLLERSGLCPFVVYERPWNATYAPASGIQAARASDWRALDQIVRAHAASMAVG